MYEHRPSSVDELRGISRKMHNIEVMIPLLLYIILQGIYYYVVHVPIVPSLAVTCYIFNNVSMWLVI